MQTTVFISLWYHGSNNTYKGKAWPNNPGLNLLMKITPCKGDQLFLSWQKKTKPVTL